MPRKGYIPSGALNPGRGCHMDNSTLKKLLLRILNENLTPSLLEKIYGLKHGSSVRICRKVKITGITATQIEAMTPAELGAMWYGKKQRAVTNSDGREVTVIRPVLPLIYQAIKNEEQSAAGGSRTSKKLRRSRELIIRELYLDNPVNQEKVNTGKYVMLSLPRVYALLKK